MNPQNYSQRTKYRPPAPWYRRLNKVGVFLTSAGLGPRDAVTLTVAGRKTGKLRRLPILKTTVAGADFLVSLAGESEWVRNVRHAAGRATIRRGRKRRAVLEELPMEERTDVIVAYLEAARQRSSESSYAKQAEFYFGLDTDYTREDVKAIQEHYPVFLINYES
jgi:hypothetical protein